MELEFIRGKINRLLTSLDKNFIERQTHIRVALLAMLSGQHVLLLGPPGTAKSLLARALCECLHGLVTSRQCADNGQPDETWITAIHHIAIPV